MNIKPRGPRTAIAALALSALLLSACSAQAPAPTGTPGPGGTIVIAEAQDTTEMDPSVAVFDVTWRISALVYETLVSTNENSEIVPGIAESWEQPSPTSYIFHLRDGVTFSNGRALSADDVVGSINRILDPETASYWAAQLGPISSVTAVDDKTVQIDLESPYTPMLASLANMTAAILPMEELNAGEFDPTKTLLGTGPFMLEEHIQDQSWTFTRSPEYWDAENVSADGVTIKVITDDAARVAALRDGSVQLASFANPDAPTLLAGITNVEAQKQSSSDMYWLQLNAVNPDSPFVDKLVRQAVAYAIDRDAIIATALAGAGQDTGIASVQLPDSCDPSALPTHTRDVEKAKELLAEAGVSDLTFDLMAPPYSPTFAAIAQVIQQNLAEAGITANIIQPEDGAYVQAVYVDNPGTFDAVVDSITGYADATMALQFLVPSRSPVTAGFLTDNDDLTAAIDAAASTEPGDERAGFLADACAAGDDHAEIVPVSTRAVTLAARTDKIDADIPTTDTYSIYFRNINGYELIQ